MTDGMNALNAIKRETKTLQALHSTLYHAAKDNLRALLAMEYEQGTSLDIKQAILTARGLCVSLGHAAEQIPHVDPRSTSVEE